LVLSSTTLTTGKFSSQHEMVEIAAIILAIVGTTLTTGKFSSQHDDYRCESWIVVTGKVRLTQRRYHYLIYGELL
jgi:hypothetical protein